MSIPTRPLGNTGEQVSLLGLGGAHIGGPPEAEGIRIVHEAIDAGVTFMDNAWEYNDRVSEQRMGKALAQDGYRKKVFLMTKDCAHDRVATHSMEKLEESLRALQTDYLDLWQIHEVVWETDPDRIFAPGGSAEAMLKAKEQGKVRFIGFTGHKHPDIHKRMLSQGFPWDTVQLPLNVLDAHYASFEREILPICLVQGIGVIGMKTNAGGHLQDTGLDISPEDALRYALSLPSPVSTILSGMDSLEVLHRNLAVANDFVPLSNVERADLLARSAPHAPNAVAEPFKSTRRFEGTQGRIANNYPLSGE
ncbi:MAG TPA: aldo/keto reductase [Thermomicrobiales bacterium]|nr:aldo/keto reductase [Thermomicrobiales bacterium]